VPKIAPISPEIPWDVKTCLAANMEDAAEAKGVLVLGLSKDDQMFWSQSGLTRPEMLWVIERARHLLMTGKI
jgi:hypothetical protein